VVVATTATFVPPAETSNINDRSPKAVVSASVIPVELYLLSNRSASIASTIRPGVPIDANERPKQLLRRNATAERLWNCFRHSSTDHFREHSPSALIAPVEN
jgi:hypothetical protein